MSELLECDRIKLKILAVIRSRRSATVGEIAEEDGLSWGVVSRHLAGMVQLGLIQRSIGERSGRQVLVYRSKS